MKQGIKVSLVHHFLPVTITCSCQVTLESTNEKVCFIRSSETYPYIFSTTSFIQSDLDCSCFGSAMGRVDSIHSIFTNFPLREDIPKSKLGDGGSVVRENSLRWSFCCRNIPHWLLQQYPVEYDHNLDIYQDF